jgi:hypothetical protein
MKHWLKYGILCFAMLYITEFACASLHENDELLQTCSIQYSNSEVDTVRFGHYNIILKGHDEVKRKHRSKLIAVAADLLTGPLGGHRIYLGTEPYVPVIYALTLGGGMGFLPVADLFVIIFTRDFEKYCDNSQVIMWL